MSWRCENASRKGRGRERPAQQTPRIVREELGTEGRSRAVVARCQGKSVEPGGFSGALAIKQPGLLAGAAEGAFIQGWGRAIEPAAPGEEVEGGADVFGDGALAAHA